MNPLSIEEARRFLFLKHGLAGEYRFEGKEGVMDFVRQAGCVQFDPVDVCGKNSELVLQSRVKGFSKEMLYSLLYRERSLIDCFDKNLAILPTEDWPYFFRLRQRQENFTRSRDEVLAVQESVLDIIREKGPVCSADIDTGERVSWDWSLSARLSRAALEHLYFSGRLGIHHKKGTIRYYDLIENCIPAEILRQSDPLPDDFDHLKWRALRRIGAVGLLWNKPSDAWLNIEHLKAAERNQVFDSLLNEGKIRPVSVEGVKEVLYFRAEDAELMEFVRTAPRLKERCEFIAPLDNLMWDRKLIKALFGFDYKWEIYTPEDQRKFGHYVLPVILGTRFIGRIQCVCDRKKGILEIKNVWYEDEKAPKALRQKVRSAAKRFARFNGVELAESIQP